MSLLNQVLQDLEKRQADVVSSEPPLLNIKAAPAPPKSLYFIWVVIIITAVLLIMAVFIYPFYQDIPQTSPLNVTDKNIPLKSITSPPAPNQKSNQRATITAVAVEPSVIPEKQVKALAPALKNKPSNTLPVKKPKIKINNQITKKPFIKKSPVLSNKQKAEKLFIKIQKQPFSINQITELKLVIDLDIQHINARLLLANSLLRLGLTEQAKNSLNQSLLLFPQNLQLINLRSQLFLQNKQAKLALMLLQQIDNNYIEDEMYLSLLASAYQQTNNHLQSLKNYQKLTKINPQQSTYWLGLAIAQDNLDNKPQALSAYQQALNKKPLQPAIVSYIKQRISALN